MELSKRLKTIARAVTPGHVAADIGTDHGYVPIYLIKEGICPRAYAMDVNPGPLERAREHIEKENLSNLISVRLSDGLSMLSPREADTVVIAGMGGELICRILGDAPEFLNEGKEFILQPQSEWFKVRHFLLDHHYQIQREWFLFEDGKYYLVLKAAPESAGRAEEKDISRANLPEKAVLPDIDKGDYGRYQLPGLNPEICYKYGRFLIREKNPVLFEYLKKERGKREKILYAMEIQGRDQLERYKEIRKEMEDIDKILDWYYNIDTFIYMA